MFRRVQLSMALAVTFAIAHGPVLAGTLGDVVGVLSSRTDVDGDGDIDLNDFGILKANFGKTGDPVPAPTIPGDITGDGNVDLTDFGILKFNFGKHAAANAVPEPSSFLLAALAGATLLAYRRRQPANSLRPL